MRLLSIILMILLATPTWAFPPLIAGKTAGGASCSSPTSADILNEGFEAPGITNTACGAAPCWTINASSDPDYSVPAAYADGKTCSYGVRYNATGTAFWDDFEGTATPSTYFGRFSMYVASHSLATTNVVAIHMAGTAAGGANKFGDIQLYLSGTQLQIRGSGAENSTAINISVATWYTVDFCMTDGGLAADGCGAGENGHGWVSIDGGATKQIFGTFDKTTVHHYSFGVLTASRTIDLILGYVQINTDGTF